MKRHYPFFFSVLTFVSLGVIGDIGCASSSSSSSSFREERASPPTRKPVSESDVFALNGDGSFGSNVPRFKDVDKNKPYHERSFLLFEIKNETGSKYPIGSHDLEKDKTVTVFYLFKRTLPNLPLDTSIPCPAGFTGPKTLKEALNAALSGRSLDRIGEDETIIPILARLEGHRAARS